MSKKKYLSKALVAEKGKDKAGRYNISSLENFPESSSKPSSSSAKKEERVNAVVEMMRNGMDEVSVAEELRSSFGCTPSKAKYYIDMAYSNLNQISSGRATSDRLAIGVLQRNVVLQKSLEKNDLRTALSALDSREKLLGIITGTGTDEHSARTIQEVAEIALRED
jgi:hypothetical protein